MKFIGMVLLCLLSFLHKEWMLSANKEMIVFFFEQLLPSMFFLIVIIHLYLSLHKPAFQLKGIAKMLGMNEAAFSLFLSALFLGFPSGAILINECYKKKQLSLKASQRMIYCTSVSSVSFMLMTLALLFQSQLFALSLYFIQIISVFLLMLATRKNKIELRIQTQPMAFFKAFSQSIFFALRTMALILAYLLVIASLRTLLLIYLPFLESLIHLTMEFSTALLHLSKTSLSVSAQFVCASALLSFAGFSVHLQVLGSCEESQLKYGLYFGYRMIQVFISVLLAILLGAFLPF